LSTPHRNLFAFIRRTPGALLSLLLTCIVSAACALPLAAQTEEEQFTPTYVTARLFQARAAKSRALDISDQLFRLRTPGPNDDEKWARQLQKAYPGTEIALLQTHALRVFKTPKPAVIYLGPRTAPHIEIQINAAFGEGDGQKLGTTLLASVVHQVPNARYPTSLAYQGNEVQTGMTYFFTTPALNLKKADYINFLRPGNNPQAFEKDDIYLIVALSVEPDKPTPLSFDVKSSAQLQAGATKKVEVQWPEAVKQAGLKGNVQVRVELDAGGKVAQAGVLNSSLPEANAAAVAAARGWEFPAAALADTQAPASAILTFDYAPASSKAESAAPPKTGGPGR
jgi:TonB family protein